MSTINQLKEAAYFEEPFMFLTQYIEYLRMGRDIRLPIRTSQAEVATEWGHIFRFLEIEVSSDFLGRLASFWLKLGLEEPVDADGLDDLEDQIKACMFQNEQSERKSEEDEINVRLAGLKESVQLVLSEDIQVQHYYESLPVLSEPERRDAIQKAIRKKDANAFIELILSCHREQRLPTVPMTFELDKIGPAWQAIIQTYDVKPADRFIRLLEAKWFYLIHVMGLPRTIEKARDMHYFVKRHPKKLTVNPDDREKFMERKINLKRFQQGGRY